MKQKKLKKIKKKLKIQMSQKIFGKNKYKLVKVVKKVHAIE